MSEQVHTVTDLPVKPSALKRWSKRAAVTALAAGAVALIIVKVRGGDDEESNTETPQA